MKRVVLLSMILASALACSKHQETTVAETAPPPKAAAAPTEDEVVKQWQKERYERLTSETGWLTLVGLHWLKEGANTFGSGAKNDFRFPADAPASAGTLMMKGGSVTLQPSAPMTIDGKPVSIGTPLLDDSQPDGPTIVQMGTIRFQVIKRGPRYGLRVKDSQAETRTKFLGLDYFPIDPKWRVVADFQPYNPVKKISITDVTGMTSDSDSPGALVFTVDGKTYSIDPVLEEGEKDYFIIFKDETSKDSTYPAARYVYTEPVPGQPNKFVIDFNKAYNPPCAFTHFATCPLPPPQNRLPVRIEAGEKRYKGGHF
jgi:uncharacterized protein (DUF1684 family)